MLKQIMCQECNSNKFKLTYVRCNDQGNRTTYREGHPTHYDILWSKDCAVASTRMTVTCLSCGQDQELTYYFNGAGNVHSSTVP